MLQCSISMCVYFCVCSHSICKVYWKNFALPSVHTQLFICLKMCYKEEQIERWLNKTLLHCSHMQIYTHPTRVFSLIQSRMRSAGAAVINCTTINSTFFIIQLSLRYKLWIARARFRQGKFAPLPLFNLCYQSVGNLCFIIKVMANYSIRDWDSLPTLQFSGKRKIIKVQKSL